jgi:hypothetical protein
MHTKWHSLNTFQPERGWRKLTIFKRGFGGLKGKALFLDLDVVIVDNMDDQLVHKRIGCSKTYPYKTVIG